MGDKNPAWWKDVEQTVATASKVGAADREQQMFGRIKGEVAAGAYESPIEAVFHAWWNALRASETSSDVELFPQREVRVGDQRYRLDFVVEWLYVVYAPKHFPHPLIAIELDGHDFHERTREQVAHRNQRDRQLQGAGWRVYHVSGSELYQKPEAVVREIFRSVRNDLWPWFDGIRPK